ncbi:Ead/Ea22-like protein [Serratia marcescens]|uniref:Ead/Ea22-like protein n=1 Tax=Serratia marcescens TaxID=615 RepID=A0AA46KAA8_SERMA|nr:ead/Ea22-like family protein [Serratia marcescens]TQI87601.1 Ead/Ea22-like protein [Serratia marcescens]TQI87662.1 Ead/Ea22-like protein [Serratia marcescens]
MTNAQINELRTAALDATPGPWVWFTSNSMVRLSSVPSGKDGDVLSAFRATDGVPCVSISRCDMEFIAAANPAAILNLLLALEEKERSLISNAVDYEYEALEAKRKLEESERRADNMAALADNYDHHRQRLDQAAHKVIEWCRQEALDRTGKAENAEFYSCVKELRSALAFVEATQ